MEYKRLTGLLVCCVDLSCQSTRSTVMYTVCLQTVELRYLYYVPHLQCKNCNKNYIGQPVNIRYREHYNDFKNRQGSSKFTQRLIDNGHSFSPINETMKILHTIRKGSMMNTLENFHIYRETKNETQINDRNTVAGNILFEVLLREHNIQRASQGSDVV